MADVVEENDVVGSLCFNSNGSFMENKALNEEK